MSSRRKGAHSSRADEQVRLHFGTAGSRVFPGPVIPKTCGIVFACPKASPLHALIEEGT